jgi:hypothetical protein
MSTLPRRSAAKATRPRSRIRSGRPGGAAVDGGVALPAAGPACGEPPAGVESLFAEVVHAARTSSAASPIPHLPVLSVMATSSTAVMLPGSRLAPG